MDRSFLVGCSSFLTVTLGFFLYLSGNISAQCPEFSFSATAGPEYRKITLTIGGQITGTAQVQYQDNNGQWHDQFFTTATGDYVQGGYGHEQTVNFRAQNGASCTGWINASATTFEVGQPWLNVWPGPGNSVYIQSGAVFPDMNSAVLWSSTGDEPFTFHSSWQTLPPSTAPPQTVPITPNHTYYFYARIDLGNNVIRRTPTLMVRLSPDQDLGSCNNPWNIQIIPSPMVGQPVNTINGNMFVSHTDYKLPGIGRAIDLTRSYNSLLQYTGMFGYGWTTEYDQYLTQIDTKNIRLQMPDGRAVYFARVSTNTSFSGITPGSPGEITMEGDGTYLLTIKDGRTSKFSISGALLWEKDRNGNQTTLNYDTAGLLTGVTDPSGRTLSINTESNGLVSQISDSVGVVATYEYYPSTTLLKSVSFLDGSKYQFEYDTTSAPGKTLLKTVKDALNNILETHLYDNQGRATTSEVHGNQERYTFDYSNSSFTSVTDGLGRVTKYHFDRTNSRNVIKKIEGVCACGGSGSETTEFFYDSNLNLIKQTDALLRDTSYTYDSNFNITSITDLLGTRAFTYNNFGQVLTYKDRFDSSGTNNTVVNTFDANGNLITTTDRLGYTTTLTYTSQGQLATLKDARNNTTTLTYDSQGRLAEIKDANNKMTNFGYDARARVTSVTNAKNETTSFTYDFNNRPKRTTFPDTNYIEHTYDLAGRRTATRDARGNSRTFGYDGAYRLTSVTDPLNHATTFGYDLMSNMTSQTDVLGNVTNVEYDDFNRLKKVIYPAAASGAARLEESVTYDKLGNAKTRTDTAGRATTYDYDVLNRLIKITDADNKLTQFEYNLRSQLTKVKDALNQEYIFTYDPLGRVLSQTRAGATMAFEYDPVGNRTKRTDYAGRVTNYEYDVLNRLKKITYVSGSPNTELDPTVNYTYDELSRLLTAANSTGTVTFTYDNRDRLKTETDVWGKVIEYGYDANSNRTQLKLDGTNYATYAYDNADRLSGITNIADSATVTYGYDNANRLISRSFPNGVLTSYEYDGMSRLKRLKHQAPGGTVTDNQYSYNAANQISQIAELSQTKAFMYDNLGRLTSMTNGTANESYAFDGVGNRTSSHLSNTYSYQPFNKLTATQTGNYAHDANGNTVTKSEGSKFWRYTYDYENRLTRAADRKATVRHQYDALGRRVAHLGGAKGSTKFTYDGDDVIVDDAGGTLTKYINGPGIDNKLSVKQGSVTNYFLADHLGSTNALIDSTGAVTSSASYDSFGNQIGSLATRYGFTGRERDDVTGLMYYRARFYDPKLGRFISQDPIGFSGDDINLYSYVWNNPANNSDPSGLFPSQLGFYHHQNIIRRALSGRASDKQIEALAREQYDFDSSTQDESYAPWHAMTRSGQNPIEARREANMFVRMNICLARKLASKGYPDAAMPNLSRAIHTLQDASSPAHFDFQTAWADTGVRSYWNHRSHYITETMVSPSSAVLAQEQTRNAWDYYSGAKPMPSDFFRNNLFDTSFGPGFSPSNTPNSPDWGKCGCE